MEKPHHPAAPILASTLLDLAQQKRRSSAPNTHRGAHTLCPALDDGVLDGRGFPSGRISVLSCSERDVAAVLVARVVADRLLNGEAGERVAVVDTRGGFDVGMLVGVLGEVVKEGEERVMGMLERVRLMRCFDWVGVVEAVGEVKGELERGGKVERRLEVPDSEDEEGEEVGETQERPGPIQEQESHGRIGLLVIDNIAHVLTPLMKNNYVHAHALMTPFLRHLAHLTRTHNTCTIIMSSTTPLRQPRYAVRAPTSSSPAPSSSPYDRTGEAQEKGSAEVNPSIFSSNAVKPALGKTFPYFADLHLLVTKVPKNKVDAAAALDTNASSVGLKKIEYVSVVEVLADRYGGQVGKWAAVSMSNSGRIEPAFP